MKKNRDCIDCSKYVTIDVFKGYCRSSRTDVMGDQNSCNDFEYMKKCKFCKHYTEKEFFIGFCMDETLVYPDLISKTCKKFKWKKDLSEE